jgi:hypothetical protein
MVDSLIDAIREKRARLSEARAEVARLESELREAKAELLGRPTKAPKLRARRATIARRRPVKTGSSVDLAVQVLRAAGKPLHISDIIAQIHQTTGHEVLKTTLVSNLSRYVQDGETFTRPSESTYGLKEFDVSAA